MCNFFSNWLLPPAHFKNGSSLSIIVYQTKEYDYNELNKAKTFKDISIFHGVMTWKDGEIDIAPETVYEESYPYNSADVI